MKKMYEITVTSEISTLLVATPSYEITGPDINVFRYIGPGGEIVKVELLEGNHIEIWDGKNFVAETTIGA